jgi:hypothetical protein
MLRISLSTRITHAVFSNNRPYRRLTEMRSLQAVLVQDRLCASDVIHPGSGGGRWP